MDGQILLYSRDLSSPAVGLPWPHGFGMALNFPGRNQSQAMAPAPAEDAQNRELKQCKGRKNHFSIGFSSRNGSEEKKTSRA